MQRIRFFIHSLSHLVNDSYGGFLAPLLPLLTLKYDLSLTSAGLLVTAQTLSASLFQPLWGWISDRHPSRWFIIGGVFTSGFFFSLLGVAPDVFTLVLLIIAGGMGISCFHPMATALATSLVSRRKGLAIAIFVTAGTGGYALGPIYISCLVDCAGLDRMYLAVIPAVAMIFLWIFLGPKITPNAKASEVSGKEPSDYLPAAVPWKPIALLSAISTIRAFVLLTFINFMSFHLLTLDLDLRSRSLYLFALLFGDSLGSLVGGGLSDRLGRWRIMLWSPLVSLPLFYFFLFSSGLFSLLLLFLAGICIFASAPAALISSQKLMLRREGMASALQIGFAWGSAGLLMGPVGKLGEIIGVYQVLLAVASLPVLMSLLALMLKTYQAQFEA